MLGSEIPLDVSTVTQLTEEHWELETWMGTNYRLK